MRDEHGSCKECGFNLNGDYIYDYFFRFYKDDQKAFESASLYKATRDKGRFGQAIYMKEYNENGMETNWWKCSNCEKECY